MTMRFRSTLLGDGPCADCGTTDNIIWFTDNVLWNVVMREDDKAISCPRCFIAATEARGYRPTGWRLTPEWPWANPDTAGDELDAAGDELDRLRNDVNAATDDIAAANHRWLAARDAYDAAKYPAPAARDPLDATPR